MLKNYFQKQFFYLFLNYIYFEIISDPYKIILNNIIQSKDTNPIIKYTNTHIHKNTLFMKNIIKLFSSLLSL